MVTGVNEEKPLDSTVAQVGGVVTEDPTQEPEVQPQTTNPAPVSPAPVVTPEPEIQVNRLDAFGAALVEDNLVGNVINSLGDNAFVTGYQEDPNFTIEGNPENLKRMDKLGSEYWDDLQGAVSQAHFDHLYSKYEHLEKSTEYLNSLGFEGAAYRFVAFLGDVPMISAVTKLNAAGKLGSIMGNMHKSYAGRAFVAGTTEGAIEAAKQNMSPRERKDYEMLLALGVGGTLGGLWKPEAKSMYANEMMPTMQKLAQEQSQAIEATGHVAPVTPTAQKIIEGGQFNVISMFERSPSQRMVDFGRRAFNNILRPNDGQFSAIESKTMFEDSIHVAFNQHMNPILMDYAKQVHGIGNLRARFSQDLQREFFEIAGRIHNGDQALINSMDPALVAKIQKANTAMSDAAYDALKAADHPLVTKGIIKKDGDFLHRQWKNEKLIEDINSGLFSKADFAKAVAAGIKGSFQKLGMGVDEAKIAETSDKFVQTLTRQQIKTGQDGYIMQDNTLRNAMEDLRDALNLSDDQMEIVEGMVMGRKTAQDGSGIASSTKGRMGMDTSASHVTESGYKINLQDYIEMDVQNLWNQYARTMGGDVALRKLGFNNRAEIAAERAAIVKELSGASGAIKAGNETYLANFDATIGELLGRTAKEDPSSKMWQVTRMINNLTRSSTLGATWFALSVEAAKVAHTAGAKAMISSLPAMRQIIKDIKGGNAEGLLKEIRELETLGFEAGTLPSAGRFDDLATARQGRGGNVIDTLERWSDNAAEATYLVGGVKSGTAMLETMFAIGMRHKAVNLAKKGALDKDGYWFFKQMGLDMKQADEIVANIRQHADTKGKTLQYNADKWTPQAARNWAMGIRRISHEQIQKGHIGDQIGVGAKNGRLVKDTHIGALALNLRNYLTIAWNKQLSSGALKLSNGGREAADVLGNWTAQTTAAMLAYVGKQHTMYWDDPDKLKEKLEGDRIAAGTFGMLAFSSFLPTAIDTASYGVTGEALIGQGSRGNVFNPLGASGDYILNKVPNAISTGVGLLSPYNDVTESELKRTFGMLPLSNAPGLKNITTFMARLFAENED